MEFGLGVLKLAPDAFWRMTPRELAAAMTPAGMAGLGLRRAEMAALMARYPDVPRHSTKL